MSHHATAIIIVIVLGLALGVVMRLCNRPAAGIAPGSDPLYLAAVQVTDATRQLGHDLAWTRENTDDQVRGTCGRCGGFVILAAPGDYPPAVAAYPPLTGAGGQYARCPGGTR